MGPQGVPEQGPVGRYFQLRDGSGSGIDENFGFGSGIGYICKTNYQSGIIDSTCSSYTVLGLVLVFTLVHELLRTLSLKTVQRALVPPPYQ